MTRMGDDRFNVSNHRASVGDVSMSATGGRVKESRREIEWDVTEFILPAFCRKTLANPRDNVLLGLERPKSRGKDQPAFIEIN
mmetsp:Transcript_39787/g.95754  ORF Transcript_39787/g.95754 Transcript_39787/m.95754 type:complete len:83 (-) Transcript_39787:154-402(-)